MRAAFLLAAIIIASPAFAQDEAGARKAVEHYLAGHATGSPAEFTAAFHPKAMLYWNRDGKLAERTSAEYIAGASGKPADDEAQRKRQIVSLDVTGNVGMAKVVLDYPTVKFTDYLSLLRVDGEWRIVNKIFEADAASPDREPIGLPALDLTAWPGRSSCWGPRRCGYRRPRRTRARSPRPRTAR